MNRGLTRITTSTQTGKIQLLSKVSTYHTPAVVYMNYMKVLEAAALDTDVTRDEVTKLLESKIASKNSGTQKDEQITPDEFVKEFLSAHRGEFTFNSNWSLIQQNGSYGARQLTLEELCSFAIGYNENTTRYKLSADAIRRAFVNARANKMMNGIDAIAEKVMYDPSARVMTDKILDFCYDWWKIKEDKDIFFTLMKQWMWQVKRYLFNRKVRYHIWLNFRGASGLGKTEWIKLFCKPFADVYSQTQVDVLLDSSREIKKLTDNYILNFDELAIHTGKATYTDTVSNADMAIIKSLLTAEIIQTRIMGGQTQMNALRTFSVISSSNDHLYDTFYDPSTMRRYFEFVCQVTKIEDYTKLNKVMSFINGAWQGIDENNDEGYFNPNTPVGQKITEIQATYYPTNTTVFAWLEELTPEMKEALSKQNANDAFKSYKSWCEQEHCHSKTRKNFIDAVKHYGVTFDENSVSFDDMLEVEPEDKFTKKPMNTEIDFTETTSMKEVEANHEVVAKMIANAGNDDFISRIR